MSKSNWRTVVKGDSTGRFTREQIRQAVDTAGSKKPNESANRSASFDNQGNDPRQNQANSPKNGASPRK
jgi:hypothetical protein